MDELEQPLTEVEQSRAATGFRYYLATPQAYEDISNYVDSSRGYPRALTHRGLPEINSVPDANDGSGKKIIAIDCWRINQDDDAVLADPIAAGAIKELTHLEYINLKPQQTEEI
jgi:hypothetical protein